MKELVIISGKGGTGKTSLTGAFAALAENHVLCDADVDAADLHLLLKPNIKQRTDFIGGNKAIIKQDICNQCRTCIDLCRFEAISESFEVDLLDCEGCGVCVALCPEKAIDFPQQKCGEWFISETRFGPMVHARLGIAEENSGKLVSVIRKQAKELGELQHHNLMITDGPPGIGCPVIASITGSTAVLIVVEPTLSGLHDMERVADLARHFTIPALVCINKYDLNPEIGASIEQEAGHRGLQVVGSIPFDPSFTRAMVAGKTIAEYEPTSEITRLIKDIWHNITISDAFNKKRAEYILPVLNN
jgi:MinD superfamily P-loop ATPase